MTAFTIAIIGATGDIGTLITQELLSPQYHPTKVANVKVLTRNPSSDKAKILAGFGAQIVALGETFTAENLKGVDALINCLGHGANLDEKNAYAKAAVDAGVKVYVPSELGIDHRIVPVEHEVFKNKQAHTEYVQEVSGGKLKIVKIAVGFFLETFIIPQFGFDTKGHVYESQGSPDTKINFVGMQDIARSAARATILALEGPNSVPEWVRVTGDSKSVREIAAIMSKESGEEIIVKGNNWEEQKKELVAKAGGKGHILEYLSLISASGTVDFKGINENELVNPGESLWKWKSVQEYAVEVKGRPHV